MKDLAVKQLVVVLVVIAVIAIAAISYSTYFSTSRKPTVIGFDHARISQSVDRYLVDESKNGRIHYNIVVIEDLKRSGYMDAETYQYVRKLMTNQPSMPNFQPPPGYKNTNNTAWITMEGKTVTMLSDGSMD